MAVVEKSRAHNEWGNEDGSKASLQQENIPLEAHEILAGVNEREVACPKDDERYHWDQSENQEHRGSGPDSAECMEESTVRVNPRKRRNVPKCRLVPALSKALLGPREKISGREYPLFADQPIDLGPQRHERNQVDNSQRTQKNCGRDVVGRRSQVPVPGSVAPCNRVAMVRNKSIHEFSHESERRQRDVQPKQPTFAITMSHRAKHRFGASRHLPASVQQVNGPSKIALRNVRQLCSRVLERYKVDL